MTNQRGFVWTIGLILSIVGVAVLVSALGVGVYRMQRWCNVVCQEARDDAKRLRVAWDLDKAARVARTSELVTTLSTAWQAAATDAAQAREKLNARQSMVSALVQNVPRGARVTLPGSVARVLDASGSARSDPGTGSQAASPDPGAEARAEAIPAGAAAVAYDQRELAEFLAAGRVAYDDARQLWAECRAREDAAIDTIRKLTGDAP